MAAQNWITGDQQNSTKAICQNAKKLLTFIGKIIFTIITILSLITSITGYNMSTLIEHFSTEPNHQVEIKPLNDSDEKIIVAQTELINDFDNSLQSIQEILKTP